MTRSLKPHRDPPTSPPHLVDDGYYIEPEPVDDHEPPPARRGLGCSIVPWLALAVAVWRVGFRG